MTPKESTFTTNRKDDYKIKEIKLTKLCKNKRRTVNTGNINQYKIRKLSPIKTSDLEILSCFFYQSRKF